MEQLKTNRLLPLAIIFAGLLSCGCRRSENHNQAYHENFLATKIARALEMDAAINENPPVLTNLLALTNYLTIEFLASYEQRFLGYGVDAGFSNSLLDRYRLLPKGVKGPLPDDGEIILVGTKPLKNDNGRLERVVIVRHPMLSNRFGVDWIGEEQIQETLNKARIRLSSLPSQAPMPSMRQLYDPDGKVAANQKQMKDENDKAFAEFRREHPIPLTQRPYFPHACMGVLTIALVALVWWFFRRDSKPSQ